jgi:hypothetical protein
MTNFEHEPLEVYKAGLEFIAGADKMTKMFAPARAYIGQQLNDRAGTVVLGIAKGASEEGPEVKAEAFRIARRAAIEGAALLDVCKLLKLGDEASLTGLRKVLLKLVEDLGNQVHKAEALIPVKVPPVTAPSFPGVPAPPPVVPPAAPPSTEEFI